MWGNVPGAWAGRRAGAALFFGAYEATRRRLGADSPAAQATAACVGEVFACGVRVPAGSRAAVGQATLGSRNEVTPSQVETIKQRQQAGQVDRSLVRGATQVLMRDGLRGFYRGFGATVGREVPFACIQMRLLEHSKPWWAATRGEGCCTLISTSRLSRTGEMVMSLRTALITSRD